MSNNPFQENYNVSIKHYDSMINILQKYFNEINRPIDHIVVHDKKDNNRPDKEENTDMTLHLKDSGTKRVCCRIRRFKYYNLFFQI